MDGVTRFGEERDRKGQGDARETEEEEDTCMQRGSWTHRETGWFVVVLSHLAGGGREPTRGLIM